MACVVGEPFLSLCHNLHSPVSSCAPMDDLGLPELFAGVVGDEDAVGLDCDGFELEIGHYCKYHENICNFDPLEHSAYLCVVLVGWWGVG